MMMTTVPRKIKRNENHVGSAKNATGWCSVQDRIYRLFYRKNPSHKVEFCHPGDSSYDEEEAQAMHSASQDSKADSDEGGEKKALREKGLMFGQDFLPQT